MFVRSILIPSLLVCAISAPFLLSEKNVSSRPEFNPSAPPISQSQFASFSGSANSTTFLPNPPVNLPQPSLNGQLPLSTTSRNLSVQSQYAPQSQLIQQSVENPGLVSPRVSAALPRQSNNPALRTVPFGLVSQPSPAQPSSSVTQKTDTQFSPFQYNPPQVNPTNPPQVNPTNFGTVSQQPIGPPAGMAPMTPYPSTRQTAPFAGMTPDLAATQTFVFSGNALGPDLTSAPLEFMPITDFREIFRFDITPDWVKQRWNRVSTNPGDIGLRGLRVALVTGTNSWDLHGSLTYYFDRQQQLQRISFRGWTGDASRLLQLLTSQYGFESQPTTLAGFYLAQHRRKTVGGLMMKEPPVIRSDNPVEKLAIVLEVNQPDGSFSISDEFKLLIAGSH